MALNWTTYRAIPQLLTYAAAKDWHDNTKPIRGDEHGTRPCGRRDQKWFSIWEDRGAIHVGYGSGALDERQKLVTFNGSGSIIVYCHSKHGSASTNERIGQLLNVNVGTYQYDTWIKCAYYDNGTKNFGYQKLATGGPNEFVRDGNNHLVFLNYKYPVTHKINRQKMKEVMQPFAPFMQYVEGLRKLNDGYLTISDETKLEVFPPTDAIRWAPVPNLRWVNSRLGKTVQEVRAEFFQWVQSEDATDMLKAAVVLHHNCSYRADPLATLREYVLRTYGEAVVDKYEHRDGKLVRDRLRNYFL